MYYFDKMHVFFRLLLYGVVCTMQDKNEAAETFFEAATSFEPKSILAWTMLGKKSLIHTLVVNILTFHTILLSL